MGNSQTEASSVLTSLSVSQYGRPSFEIFCNDGMIEVIKLFIKYKNKNKAESQS